MTFYLHLIPYLFGKGFFYLEEKTMAVRILSTPTRLTVELIGEIDHHNAAVLRMETDEAIQKRMPPNVRLDFGEVTFIDSSAIGFVLGRYRLVSAYSGNIEVVNLSERNYRIMRLAGLEKLVMLRKKENKNENCQ